MKAFLKQLGLFFLPPLVCIVTGMCYVIHVNKKLLANYMIAPEITTLVIGDSHTEMAIDDRRIPGLLNLSQGGESYIFSYAKLLTLLKNNPQVNRVILGCSYHDFSAYYDKYIYGKFGAYISSRYFFMLPHDMQFRLLQDMESHRVSLIWQSMKNELSHKAKGKYEFEGGYNNEFKNTRATDSSARRRIKGQYYIDSKLQDFCTENLYFFDKIVALCKEKNVELIIINTPLYPGYAKEVPAKFKDKFYSLINGNKLPLIELNKQAFSDSCFLPDGDHLSQMGAVQTSDYLKEILEKKAY